MPHSISKLEKKSFDSPDETRTPFEKGRIDVLHVGGLVFQRETLEPGWKWSEDVRPKVGGDSCQKFHVKFILSGRQHVVMEDGTEEILEAGDVAVMPPGHDAWVEGDQPNVLLELIALTEQ